MCVFLGGDFDKWETLFCILLEPWVLFRPGCIVRRNQHTLYLTPKSRLHEPTSRKEQGSLALEGHRESPEVATWKLSSSLHWLSLLLSSLLLQQPCQGTTLPPQTLRSLCTLSTAAFLPLGCPVAPLQSCSLLLSSGVCNRAPRASCAVQPLQQSRRQHRRTEIGWSCAPLSCLTLCSAFDASTTRAP